MAKIIRSAVLLFFFLFPIVTIVLNIYMMYVPDTGNSYSITQSFEQYQAIDNWNLPVYADGLFDSDTEIDLIFNNGCAYLTQAIARTDWHDQECEAKNPAFRRQGNAGTPINGQKVFHGLSQSRPLGVVHSFAAKKPNENWKIYEQVNGSVTVHEILPTGEVIATSPTVADRLDALWYFVSHLFSII